jgi:hypothetical protein
MGKGAGADLAEAVGFREMFNADYSRHIFATNCLRFSATNYSNSTNSFFATN